MPFPRWYFQDGISHLTSLKIVNPLGSLLTIIYFGIIIIWTIMIVIKTIVMVERYLWKCDSMQRYDGLSKMVLWTCTSKKTKGTQSCFRWKCWFIFLHCFSIFVSISHKSAETSIKIVKQIFYVFCGYQTNKVSWSEFSFIFHWIVFDYLYQICCWCTFVHSNIF